MTKTILGCFTLFMTLGCKIARPDADSHEQSKATAPQRNHCSLSDDVFEPDSRFPQNTAKGAQGRCIDTRTARPIVVLNSAQAKEYGYDNTENKVVLANVTHRNKFYVAAIPIAVGDIGSIIFQQENFESNFIPAAHAQIRLDFTKPVLLTPQNRSADEAKIETKQLVLSMEALGETGAQFDVIKGLQNEYMGVWRIKTLSDFAVRMDNMKKKDPAHPTGPAKIPTVKQYLLAFQQYPEKRVAILKNWIRKSTERQLSVPYNTITSSCAMEAMNLIESVRPSNGIPDDDKKIDDFFSWFRNQMNQNMERAKNAILRFDGNVSTPFEVYPVFSRESLKIRGLFERELPELGDDPIFRNLLELK